jgi:hypothetical protein
MPTYTFRDINTGEIEEHVMKISQLEEFKKNNTHLEMYITGSPGLSDPARLGLVKPAAGFRDLLKNMKKKHRRSTINDF